VEVTEKVLQKMSRIPRRGSISDAMAKAKKGFN